MTTALRLAPCVWMLCFATACQLFGGAVADPLRYRLVGSGDYWDVVGSDRVFADLEPRYASFFGVILDPTVTHVPNLLEIRDDLERAPVDRRNYDALNAIAIAYFETNYRAESQREDAGMEYLSLSHRSAQLLAVPWRAYSEIEESALRNAILDFFEDAGVGEKLGTGPSASRLVRIVSTLARKEDDPARRDRIDAIANAIHQRWVYDPSPP